jgi:hypothetical protein
MNGENKNQAGKDQPQPSRNGWRSWWMLCLLVPGIFFLPSFFGRMLHFYATK